MLYYSLLIVNDVFGQNTNMQIISLVDGKVDFPKEGNSENNNTSSEENLNDTILNSGYNRNSFDNINTNNNLIKLELTVNIKNTNSFPIFILNDMWDGPKEGFLYNREISEIDKKTKEIKDEIGNFKAYFRDLVS